MSSTELQETSVAQGLDRTATGGNDATDQDLNGNVAVPVQAQDDALQGRELVAVLEALLFVSAEPLSLARLATAIGGVSKSEVEQALNLFSQQLAQDGRGIQLVKLAGGYRLMTKPDYAPWLKRLDKAKAVQKLSRSALESLAIIAYKQPLVRAEIEEIRGVETSGVLRTLLERKLVRIVGRKEVPGRPIMYGTTKFFLEHFGLHDIAQLPPLREFKELGEAEQALLPIEDSTVVEEPATMDAESQTFIDSPVLAADEGDTLLVS
ncbi:MAG TPA: SMC-Scp complex subunit ScpB [Nitrospira sp.]|nr:SMC-Scp complex subunit ScpB [Nitrospira sp.]